MKRLSLILTALIVLVSLVFVSCSPTETPTPPTPPTPPPPEKDPYLLGICGSLTGPYAITYLPIVDGMRIYLETVNERGGINGREVKMFIEDSQGSATEAAMMARKLTEMGAQLLAFSDGSPMYGGYGSEAKRAEIPAIFYGMSPLECMPPDPDPLMYNGVPYGSAAGVAGLGAYLIHQYVPAGGVGGIITFDSPVMKIMADMCTKICKETYGISEVVYRPIPIGTLDLTPVAMAFKDAGAGACENLGGGGLSFLLHDALEKIGFTGWHPLIVADPCEGPFERYEGAERVGAWLAGGEVPLAIDCPTCQEIKAAAQEYGVSDLNSQLTLGWEAGMVTEAILEKVGWPVTTEKLVEVMQDFEFKRPLAGTLKWTEGNHCDTTIASEWVWDKAKGEWVYNHKTGVIAPTGEVTEYEDWRDIP